MIASAPVKPTSEIHAREDLQVHGKADDEQRQGDDPKWSEPATSDGFPYVSNIVPVHQEGSSTRGSTFWPLDSPEGGSIQAVVSEQNEHGGWRSKLKTHTDDEADGNAAVREGDERRGGVEAAGGHVRPGDGMSRWQPSGDTDVDADSGPRLSREGDVVGTSVDPEPEMRDDLSRQSRRTTDTEGEKGDEEAGEAGDGDGGAVASRHPRKWAQEEAETGEVSVTHLHSPPWLPETPLVIPGTRIQDPSRASALESALHCLNSVGRWEYNATPRWLPWDLNPLDHPSHPNYRTCDALFAET